LSPLLQHLDVMNVDEWVWIVYELSPVLCYLLKKFGSKSMHTMNDKWVCENGFSDFLNDTSALDRNGLIKIVLYS